MGNRLQLDRLGSDPEFVFVDPTSGNIHPADRLVGTDRNLRLAAWVGTDGHAATAEIRPGPAHNVLWHLYKVADAMAQTKGHLVAEGLNYQAVAQPLYNHETMGGHIHISAWYNGPLTTRMVNEYKLVRCEGKLVAFGTNPTDYDQTLAKLYTAAVNRGDEIDLSEIVAKVHYLVGPLEHAVFGSAREQRWHNNPQVRDLWRIPENYHPPFIDSRRAYLRIEYRYPSTFLHSPLLAYCYFGLAKLALLNFDLIPAKTIKDALPLDGEKLRRWREYQQMIRLNEQRVQMGRPPHQLPFPPPPAVGVLTHADWRKVVRTRTREILDNPRVRLSNDLKRLPKALAAQLKLRLKAPLLVDFDGWATLLNSSGRQLG